MLHKLDNGDYIDLTAVTGIKAIKSYYNSVLGQLHSPRMIVQLGEQVIVVEYETLQQAQKARDDLGALIAGPKYLGPKHSDRIKAYDNVTVDRYVVRRADGCTEDGAQYFVLRLDGNGDDRVAARVAARIYIEEGDLSELRRNELTSFVDRLDDPMAIDISADQKYQALKHCLSVYLMRKYYQRCVYHMMRARKCSRREAMMRERRNFISYAGRFLEHRVALIVNQLFKEV